MTIPRQNHEARVADQEYPGLPAMASFFVRSKGLQLRRAVMDTLASFPRLNQGAAVEFPFVLAESVSPLHTGDDPRERPLVLGKIENLRLACRKIHHRVLAPGQTFSFWRQVGPPWRWRGFVRGREVREGCVIPTYGGGLCQLSGSLLETATALGCELAERHRHTALPAGIASSAQRDATLFWNYVDLRFRSPVAVLFECSLSEDALVIRLRGKVPRVEPSIRTNALSARSHTASSIQSCYVCRQTDCSRHRPQAPREQQAINPKTAFLVDDYQPEFDSYLQAQAGDHDLLVTPFAPGRGERGWSSYRFEEAHSFPWFRWRRAWTLRRAVSRGITVAKAHFALAQSLAELYQAKIGYDVEHLCVAQSLAPHLWRAGVLGGRTFDVLMQRLPARVLEQQLDEALRLYPESATLNEFRAPRWFVEAEEEALSAARWIVTPHSQIAALFPKTTRLAWETPSTKIAATKTGQPRNLILFPGPTLARKGAYAVRDAMREHEFSLAIAGADLESPDFWRGLPVTRVDRTEVPWERVLAVLQPALFEYWPRQLLRAHAAGTALVISPGCGMEEDRARGIYQVPFGDSSAILAAIKTILSSRGDGQCARLVPCLS